MYVSKHIWNSPSYLFKRCFGATAILANNSTTKILHDTDAETSLWFTTLPHQRKNSLQMKQKKRRIIPEFIPKGSPIISCKNPTLNHYSGQRYDKFQTVPLASKGWHHRESSGDYFTINPTTDHPAFIMTASDANTAAGNFDEAGLDPWICDTLIKKGVTKLTTIQAKSIPKILAGKNTLLVAETGCGKTMAYLLPMIQRCAKWKEMISNRAPNSPLGVVVVPNRELALQVGSVVKDLCENTDLKCQTILGGHTKQLLTNPMIEEVDIVVATLGVLSKLTTHRQYNIRECKHLVLDEADTLLDDSFNEKMLHFMRRFPIQFNGPESELELPHGTQVTLVSATMPTRLDPLIGQALSVDSLEKISTKYLHRVLPHVPQTFLRVKKSEKASTLLHIARRDLQASVPLMIFSNKAAACDWVSLFLNENGVPCERVNSKMNVDARLGKYQQFRNGEVNVISCTDLTSRGIDTTTVKHVVNFDFPLYMADYIHRCGRTGRIGHDNNCKITNIISSRREVDLLHQIETAARTFTELHNVNNNITRIIHYKKEKAEAKNAETEVSEEQASVDGDHSIAKEEFSI